MKIENKSPAASSSALCYLCGRGDDLTRDHLPPKGFFPPPRPHNLITVTCCRACNNSFQLDDEAMRAFFSLAINRSNAGDIIWNKNVMGRSIPRSPRFREYLLGRVLNLAVATPFGIETLPAFEVPTDRIERFLIRMTKGFLRNYYPAYDYSTSTFHVRNLSPTESNLRLLEQHLVGTTYDERGEGVIRYRYGISDTGLSGMWFYMFYDAVWFLVVHQCPNVASGH